MKSKQILLIAFALSAMFTGLLLQSQPAVALECAILPGDICKEVEDDASLEESSIWDLLLMGMNILTAGVGLVAVGAIIFAGFLYATAQDNAQQTKKAMEMIRNTAIGLVLFAGMFSIVNFFVPGGVFGGGSSPPPSGPVQPAPPECDPMDPTKPC